MLRLLLCVKNTDKSKAVKIHWLSNSGCPEVSSTQSRRLLQLQINTFNPLWALTIYLWFRTSHTIFKSLAQSAMVCIQPYWYLSTTLVTNLFQAFNNHKFAQSPKWENQGLMNNHSSKRWGFLFLANKVLDVSHKKNLEPQQRFLSFVNPWLSQAAKRFSHSVQSNIQKL